MPESPNKLLNNDHGNYVFATFTGHIYDTTLDIYFAEARFYDANNRTWLAMDSLGKGVSQAFYYLNLASAVYGVYSMGAGENSAVSSQNMMIIGANGEGYIVEGAAGTPIYLIPGTTITFFEKGDKGNTEKDSESQIEAGDKTPEGREFTKHAAKRANERSFNSQQIDSIIDNNYKHRIKEIDEITGKITWRYQDSRGNTVITNEWGDKIVTVYSFPNSINGGNYIPK